MFCPELTPKCLPSLYEARVEDGPGWRCSKIFTTRADSIFSQLNGRAVELCHRTRVGPQPSKCQFRSPPSKPNQPNRPPKLPLWCQMWWQQHWLHSPTTLTITCFSTSDWGWNTLFHCDKCLGHQCVLLQRSPIIIYLIVFHHVSVSNKSEKWLPSRGKPSHPTSHPPHQFCRT